MLVAQLRKEQELNRTLRIKLAKAAREKSLAEMDAFAAICMFNDESRKVQSRINKYKTEIERLKNEIIEHKKSIQTAQDNMIFLARQNQEYREKQVKKAQIDVLERLKVFAEPYPNSWGIYVIDVYHIDELIKNIEKQ